MFNPENLFWRIISRLVDLVGLSLLWAALCLPVVTAGAATSALYYTVVRVFRQGDEAGFKTMLRSFRRNLKQGTVITLICLPVLALIIYGYSVMQANSVSDFGVIVYVMYYVAMVLPLGLVCYIFPLLGRFEQDTRSLFKTAFSLELAHLPSTVVIVLLTLELAVWTVEKWYPIFFTPVGCAFLVAMFMEKIYEKHLSEDEVARLRDEHPDEDGEEY